MTFSVQEKGAQSAEVRVTYGPISILVDEQVGHLRSFHGDLGRLLDRMEAKLREEQAQKA